MKFEPNEQAAGIASAAGAYILWGVLPVYWKLVQSVPSLEVLAHRVVWSFVFLVFVLLASKGLRAFRGEFSRVARRPGQLTCLLAASLLISINWLTFIWAVNNSHIIQTSLGYYINPLVSVLLGMLVLKERLSFWQVFSFLLALAGVLNMTLRLGSFPWVALTLAFSFGLYGLLKKMINLGAVAGITAETLIITPVALTYLVFVHKAGQGAFGAGTTLVTGLLAGAGVVTAVPLILFAGGAIRLPLATVGFLQYISPTITLLLGVFLYHEAFTAAHMVSFIFIWAALTIYSLSRTRSFMQMEAALTKKIAARRETA